MSLILVPSVTLSRWAPAIDVVLVPASANSAMTLTSVRSQTQRRSAPSTCCDATPSAKLAPTTGMDTAGAVLSAGGTALPTIRPSRSECCLVEDDDGRCAAGLGVHCFESKAASTALDQCDVAGGEAGEVVGTAGVCHDRVANGRLGESSVATTRTARGGSRFRCRPR